MNAQDLNSYDHILVAFSGGKDSLACILALLEAGADPAKIELHHHDVDGGTSFMDWPCTPAAEQSHEPSRPQFSEEELEWLLRLCHPDKHMGSSLGAIATKITQKLVELTGRNKNRTKV